MKSKKGQLAFATSIIIIIAIMALIAGESTDFNVKGETGRKQVELLKAYQEAEQIREYLGKASRLTVYKLADESNAPPSSSCFQGRNFQREFDQQMKLYSYSSPNDFEVELPTYNFILTFNPTAITVKGTPSDKIEISGEDFKYEAEGYIEEIISCEDYISYKELA